MLSDLHSKNIITLAACSDVFFKPNASCNFKPIESNLQGHHGNVTFASHGGVFLSWKMVKRWKRPKSCEDRNMGSVGDGIIPKMWPTWGGCSVFCCCWAWSTEKRKSVEGKANVNKEIKVFAPVNHSGAAQGWTLTHLSPTHLEVKCFSPVTLTGGKKKMSFISRVLGRKQ